MKKPAAIFLLILVVILGFSLRAYNLNKHDFWSDEAISLMAAKYATFQSAIDYRGIFTEPVLFPLLLKFWMYLTKEEAFYRFLPLIFGLLSIVLIYFLGKELCNKATGLIASLLISISPFHIYYSQELRNYTLLVFLSLLSVYFFVRTLKEDKISFWLWFIVSTVLCLYTHTITLFLLLAENIYFLFFPEKQKSLFKWIISQAIILVLYIPWVFVIISQIITMHITATFFWVPKPSIAIISHTFNVFNLGYNATMMLYFLGGLVFLPLFLWGILKGIRQKTKVYLLLCWMLVPLIMVILASVLMKQGSIYLPKTLIFVTPAYYILVANGINNIKNYKLSLLPVFLIVILSTVSLKNYYNDVFPLALNPYRPGIFIKKEFNAAASYIKEEFKQQDIVAHTSRSTIAPFMYYLNNNLEEKWAASKEDDCLLWNAIFSQHPALSKLRMLKPFLAEDIKKISQGYKRIWLVYSGWEFNKRESPYLKKWLDTNLKVLEKKSFKGIDVYLYEAFGK